MKVHLNLENQILINISSLSKSSIVDHVNAMLEIQKKGAVTFDYGNNIRGESKREWGSTMHLIFLDLYLSLYVPSSAMARVLSGGQCSQVILMIFM
jgi:urocanate hydratase